MSEPSDRQDQQQPATPSRKEMEREVLQQIPEQTYQSEEWGERVGTGKAIATGGKKAQDAGTLGAEEEPKK